MPWWRSAPHLPPSRQPPPNVPLRGGSAAVWPHVHRVGDQRKEAASTTGTRPRATALPSPSATPASSHAAEQLLPGRRLAAMGSAATRCPCPPQVAHRAPPHRGSPLSEGETALPLGRAGLEPQTAAMGERSPPCRLRRLGEASKADAVKRSAQSCRTAMRQTEGGQGRASGKTIRPCGRVEPAARCTEVLGGIYPLQARASARAHPEDNLTFPERARIYRACIMSGPCPALLHKQ